MTTYYVCRINPDGEKHVLNVFNCFVDAQNEIDDLIKRSYADKGATYTIDTEPMKYTPPEPPATAAELDEMLSALGFDTVVTPADLQATLDSLEK